MLFNYTQFLLESVLKVNDDFLRIINIMKSWNYIAQIISSKLINKDINTKYNYLKIDKPSKSVKFMQDTQVARKIDSGLTDADLFKQANNTTNIGRLVRSLLADNNTEIPDRDLEVFVHEFNSLLQLFGYGDTSIKVVEGEDIRYWYLEERYVPQGTLKNSCMRYERCQAYFDIYCQNPEVCKMIIKVNNDGQLEARALLWKTDKGWYIDRVYYAVQAYESLIQSWGILNIENCSTGSLGRCEIQLKGSEYRAYPYMDTFMYLDTNSNKLLNWEPDLSEDIYYLQSTVGEYEKMDRIYSEWYDEMISREYAVWSDMVSSYLHTDNSVWSDYHNDYLPDSRAVWSDVTESYLWFRNTVTVLVGDNKTDNYPASDSKYEYVTDHDGVNYSKEYAEEILFEFDDELWSKEYWILVKNIKESSIEKARDLFNNSDISRLAEVDASVFRIELEDEEPEVIAILYYFREVYKNADRLKLAELVEKADVSEEVRKEKARLDKLIAKLI